MGFSGQENWSGLPFLSPADLPNLGIELRSPALQADSTIWARGKPKFVTLTLKELFQFCGHSKVVHIAMTSPNRRGNRLRKAEVMSPQTSPITSTTWIWVWLQRASLVAQTVKNLPAMQETWIPSPGREDHPLGKGMATHSSIFA